MKRFPLINTQGAVTLALLLGVAACGDQTEAEPPEAAPEKNELPVYLFTLAVYAPQTTLQYSLVRNELDLDISVNDLKKAHEFAGYTGVAAIDGYVVSGDSETPFATKWSISDDLKWKQVGNKLNFSDYFSADGDGLNFYFQAIRGTGMDFFYGAERTSRVHWDVEDWKIIGKYDDTQLPTREGWTLSNNGNRTGLRDFKGPIVQPFTFSNDVTDLLSDDSWLAVYDPKTHLEKAVIEVPCPGVQQGTKDEDGNLYFGTTYNAPTRALYGKGPASCVVKVKADGTLDESFEPNDLTAWTGGFYGLNFRYLSGGKAVANVLHHDRLGEVDFTGEIDAEIETKISGRWTEDAYLAEDPTLWELHLIDLEEGSSTIIEGFKPEHDVSYYSIFFEVEDRTFIAVQFTADEITNNAVYELDLEKARVKLVGEVAGDLTGIERVR